MIYTKEKIKEENEKMKKRRKIRHWLFLPVMLLIIGVSLYVGFHKIIKHDNNVSIFGFQQYVVMTGSMSPEYEIGDLVVIKKVPQNAIQKGDIITYAVSDSSTVTHRVVAIENRGGELYYQTKGDSNNSADGFVPYSLVEGKAVIRVPKLGEQINRFMVGIGPILIFIIVMFSYTQSVHEEERLIAREEARKKFNTCKYKKESVTNDSL